ncbi:hypothetical protein ABT307_31490, partial [Streptomyces anulatus]
MSASDTFPQVRGVTLLGSSPTRPTERPQAESFWPAETRRGPHAGADLPVQESALWREHADKHGLATVFV